MPETVLTAWGLMELGEGVPMPEPERGQCRGCGAAVTWVRMAKTGALAPIDPDPCADGNVVIMADGRAVVIGRGDLFDQPPADLPRYRSHFQSCREAKRFRRRK